MSGAEARMVKAMLCHDLSGPGGMAMGEIRSLPPGPGEMRIGVRAAGVNFPDLLMSRGQYQFKPEPPFAPGMEVSGVVLDIGDGVEGFSPGDRVIAWTQSMYPGFAEETTLPARHVLPTPEGMDDIAAAGFFLTYYTSCNALIDKARLQPGEWALVHGAAGGVGLAATQIARAAGARVIAAVGSAAKAEFMKREGVDAVIDYSHEDIRERVKEITGGRGADVALDPVGGAAFDASMRCLAPGGRLLIVGFTSGGIGAARANIVLIKEISLIGVRAGEHALRHPDRMRAAYARLTGWFERGLIAPRIAARFPLDRAAEALSALENRAAIGKVVVTIE
ncbi:MAG: NADPH:quinone oxidoreductase family protein [Pikeienuella sp.]